MSSRRQSILKTISWRIVGTADTVLIGWLLSGDWKLGLTIGGVEFVTKMILYYLHERAWHGNLLNKKKD